MALESEDREDLLRDAKGLPHRGQFSLKEDATEIVVGFRSDGSASWYFGPDPVFQFDPSHRLRRVFCKGQRYAVTQEKIIHLQQQNRGGRIQLQKHPLNEVEQRSILSTWHDKIAVVQRGFADEAIQWEGTSIDQGEFETQVREWLEALPSEIVVAKTSRLPRSNQ